jgi:hypothetical protein
VQSMLQRLNGAVPSEDIEKLARSYIEAVEVRLPTSCQTEVPLCPFSR